VRERFEGRGERELGCGQAEDERGAFAGCVLQREFTAHRLNEAAGDGEPEPESAMARIVPVAETLKWLEHLITPIEGDAGSPVDHTDLDVVTRDAASTRTSTPGGDHSWVLASTPTASSGDDWAREVMMRELRQPPSRL
jgi:hypothetical protein